MRKLQYTPDQPDSIQLLFTRIAPNYDLTNHVISLGFDVLWRRKFARLFATRQKIADICCGSGAMFPVLKSRIKVGLDFTHAMLQIASERTPRINLVQGDAQRMPFDDSNFDAAIIVYSIRNIPDVDRALTELFRILQPGGSVGILDFGIPNNFLGKFVYLLYFKRVMPYLGSLVARDPNSYHYFVNSVMNFPKREEFVERLRKAGFENCSYRTYTGGAAISYIGSRPKS
jgi:demethylmenaquinone methyltransferase / 2-methoxy-6-polyprenyl-1,4-benzoquinol methylase